MLQKKIFIESEADSWYQRNKNTLINYNADSDIVLNQLKDYDLTPQRVLEIGCSFGYRLNGLKSVFPKIEVHGIDPSRKAINHGNKMWKNINLKMGTIDDLSMYVDNFFDLIIVGFVFYVVDRNLLIKSIGEIDRLLKHNGHIQILDFGVDKFRSSHYHHVQNKNFYSYKQEYYSIFKSTGIYHLIDLRTFSHSTLQRDHGSNFNDKINLTLLVKNSEAIYK